MVSGAGRGHASLVTDLDSWRCRRYASPCRGFYVQGRYELQRMTAQNAVHGSAEWRRRTATGAADLEDAGRRAEQPLELARAREVHQPRLRHPRARSASPLHTPRPRQVRRRRNATSR
jgi:hypothetical protein